MLSHRDDRSITNHISKQKLAAGICIAKKCGKMGCSGFNDVQDKAQFYSDLVRLHSPGVHDFAFVLVLNKGLCLSYNETCALLGADKL